jgi:hypothetical protein
MKRKKLKCKRCNATIFSDVRRKHLLCKPCACVVWRQNNSIKTKKCHKVWKKQYSAIKLEFLLKAKDKPCMDCHKSYPYYVMDFDHREPSKKLRAIAQMVGLTYSFETFKKEIAKCDLVCSNCHRIRTHKDN